MPKNKIKKRRRAGRSPEGKQYWKTYEVAVGQPPSVDEIPPPGLEEITLSKDPPLLPREKVRGGGKTHAAYVSEALDKKADAERRG